MPGVQAPIENRYRRRLAKSTKPNRSVVQQIWLFTRIRGWNEQETNFPFTKSVRNHGVVCFLSADVRRVLARQSLYLRLS